MKEKEKIQDEIQEKAEKLVEEEKEKELKKVGGERRRYKRKTDEERAQEEVERWIPKTNVGRLVKKGKLKDIDEILRKHRILEHEIVDSLVNLKSDLLLIGQSKGKFGGGKRRAWKQTQKKTKEGNVPSFSTSVVVGNEKGYIGLGTGKAKETLPARAKALRYAKLNLFKFKKGCGSFDCLCNEPHCIPYKVEGKCGSSKVVLIPAPQGTGLVISNECKKILRLTGIKDIYSKTFGQTRTTVNLAKACVNALKKLEEKGEEK